MFRDIQAPLVVLEVGCGAGNTVFPLVAESEHVFVYAADFSQTAVDIVIANPGPWVG